MNIIITKQQEIRQTNNTAQSDLETILGKLYSTNDIVVTKPLSGDIDLSILDRRIKSIQFTKGNITRVETIPSQILTLEIPNQLLTEFPELTANIQTLNIENNHIDRLQYTACKQLSVLKISNNQFTELPNLPETLEELYCDNNRIKILDLANLPKLTILHISNNRTTHIYNIPPTLKVLKTDGNENVQLHYKNMYGSESNTDINNINMNVTRNVDKDTPDYNDALDLFFTIRNVYYTKINEERRHILTNTRLIKSKLKRKQMASSITPKCLSCNRLVGNMFSSANSRYTVKCGDSVSPCDFSIELYRGEAFDIDKMLAELSLVKNSMQQSIIESKLKLIFHYENEENTTKIFNEFVTDYTKVESEYKKYLQFHNELYFDETRAHLLTLKQAKLQGLVQQVRDIMSEYKLNPDQSVLLQRAVEIQVREVLPELKNIQKLMYEQMNVERIPIYKLGGESVWSNFRLHQYYSSTSKRVHVGAKQPTIVKWSVPNSVTAVISTVKRGKNKEVNIPIV